ncbi:MAG: hypothetical protein JW741_19500 [Sedimentisphaerales bacterium]|nr:hypothetical protein [Sedimentisphaerales bacterium]
MTPPPGDGSSFSSSQDAGANPVDAALDKAARIAETLLQNIGPAESKAAPPPAPEPAAESTTAPPPEAAPTPAPAPPAEAPQPVEEAPLPADVPSVKELEPDADTPAQTTDAPGEAAAEPPAEPVAPTEPPSVVVPTTDDINALLGDAPIEDQLERIEGLLDEAQAQIGGETPAKGTAAPADPLSDASVGEPDLAVPDGLPAEADIRFDDEEAPGGREDSQAAKARSRWLDPDTASGQFIILLQDALCGLLDRVDRPFVRVPYAARQILGVCAAVTLLASLVTLLLACL